ncbi:Ifh1 protein [Martiniozyma asiatica (nom. inval.)]|nr:Ifh1 protein [Martiniozyma asiatica]
MALISSDDDDSSSSDSDDEDENVDYVRLTKERRMKAMKAVKGFKHSNNNNNNNNNDDDDDDDDDDNYSNNNNNNINSLNSDNDSGEGELIEQREPELDDDEVDAAIEKEEKFLDDENDSPVNITGDFDIDDDLDDIDFDMIDDNILAKNKNSTQKKSTLLEEDIGEAVDMSQTNNKNSTIISNKNIDEITEMKVPKFDDGEINSDDDYSFDKDELIQTLIGDNDDSELHMDEDSEDDFDKLVASRRQFTPGSEHDLLSAADLDNELSDADSDKLMDLETKAMVDDYYDNQSKQLRLRRGSMYRGGSVFDNNDDLDMDRLDNFEAIFPKQQAFRRRSSILEQSLLSSSDEEGLIKLSSKSKSKSKSKKSKKSKSKKAEIRQMLGTVDEIYSDAIDSESSNDDTNLLMGIFEDTSSLDGIEDDETDVDEELSKKNTSKVHAGTKPAKELLSSQNFGAPPLGTFVTKKPFSVIDGMSTGFVRPFTSPKKQRNERKISVKSQNDPSSNALELGELLNIEEMEADDEEEEKISADHESHHKLQEMFGEKHIPLTAFRNKGLENRRSAQILEIEAVNKKLALSEKKARKKHHKLSKKTKSTKGEESKKTISKALVAAQAGPVPVNSNNEIVIKKQNDENILNSDYVFANNEEIDGFAAIASDEEFFGSLDDIPELGDDEILLIDLEDLPMSLDMDGTNVSLDLTDRNDLKKNRRMSKVSFSQPLPLKSRRAMSKSRMRRASVVEAQAEGLRATKNGVFDESVIEDVEAFLIDVGGADEFSFLYNDL